MPETTRVPAMIAAAAATLMLAFGSLTATGSPPPPKASCRAALSSAVESFTLTRIGISVGVVGVIEALNPASEGQPLTLGEVANLKKALAGLNRLVVALELTGSIVREFNKAAAACQRWADG